MRKMMKSIEIQADRAAVWSAIISDEKYRLWTSAFMEGSRFEGGWQTGDRIRFLSEEPDGTVMGMVAEIAASECPAFLSIHHLHMIQDGQEIEAESDPEDEPAYENYRLDPLGEAGTLFQLAVDVEEAYYDDFDTQWDNALIKLKEVCEQKLAAFEEIVIETTVSAPVGKAWEFWTLPELVTRWNAASSDWYCPKASNQVQAGGRFIYTMAARDGSFSFDFAGTHTHVEIGRRIDSLMDDGRRMRVTFSETSSGGTRVVESFEAERMNPLEMQRAGWQAILDRYGETVEMDGRES